jgi:GR25 family glycosyltransferase involved in LPS biosynthesis
MQMLLVNLDRSPDRLEQFLRVNRHLSGVERFPAVDGRIIDRDQLVAAEVMMPDLDYTPGAVGCALSHIALWKLAVIERQPITVAEDDAVFSYRFMPCAEALVSVREHIESLESVSGCLLNALNRLPFCAPCMDWGARCGPRRTAAATIAAACVMKAT